MGEKFPGEASPENLREPVCLRVTVHKTVDQEAGRAQIFSTGYPTGDFDQYAEHGDRVSQPGQCFIFLSMAWSCRERVCVCVHSWQQRCTTWSEITALTG